MELINSNAGLVVLIGIVLNIFLFLFSQKQRHKQFEASQRLTGYIAKKTIVKEPPVEWEPDTHYPKPGLEKFHANHKQTKL